jgi:hypothetical protein
MIYQKKKLDSRIAEVLDQYSPILEGVEAKEFKEQVKKCNPNNREKTAKTSKYCFRRYIVYKLIRSNFITHPAGNTFLSEKHPSFES